MRAAYGDAIAEVFMISAIVGLVALVAILFIKEKPLRRTVDIRPEASASAAVTRFRTADVDAGAAAHAAAAPAPRRGLPGPAAGSTAGQRRCV